MLLLRRKFLVLSVLGVLAHSLPAAEFKIPPITGELTGKLKTTALTGAPEVAWKLKINPTDDGRRRAVEAELSTGGARLRFNADLNAEMSDGTWELLETKLNATVWLAILVPQLGATGENLVASGELTLSGKGELKEGQPSGVVNVLWSDGALHDSAQGWTLEGITFRGDLAFNLADLASMKSASPWDLSIRTITHSRFGARNLSMNVQFNENRTVSLLSAHVEVAGGDARVDPSTVTLFPPVLDFNLRIDRVGLQDLVALFPGSFSDAKGRIDGVVRLGWSKSAGFRVGAGRFELRDDEIATLRLTSAPGFLTDRVPERLALLPAWTGKVGEWFSPLNPVYGDVQKIELGQTELQIVSFSLELTPKGDHRNRQGVLKVNARPTAPGVLVQRVTFEININGSVSELLKLGVDEGAAFEVKLNE